MWTAVALIALGYLSGSIPTGYWLGKALKGIDIRKQGSGSTGATNVLRCLGKGPALFVLIVDVAKGYLPVWLAVGWEHSVLNAGNVLAVVHIAAPLAAAAAMIGHSKSVFLNFQGGKSAATALGTILAMSNMAGVLVFALWVILVFTTRYVSVASMITGFASIGLMYMFGNQLSYAAYCAFGATLVLLRHKANIKRLLNGSEPRLGQKVENNVDAPFPAGSPPAK